MNIDPMFEKLLRNHTLTNLSFALVLVIGALNYYQMPREQDPSINFNWVQIRTSWAGASALDVEERITGPIEGALEKVSDIKFVSSSSREGISIILVRLEEMEEDQFDNRMTDIRREIQNTLRELPQEAATPEIIETTTSNAFPTATIVVYGLADDETLRKTAHNAREDLERLKGVDRVDTAGASDPELQVLFSPQRLIGLGISPVDLADTVNAYFRNLAAGSLNMSHQEWLVRLSGTSSDPEYLEELPIITAEGEVPLRSVADVVHGKEDPLQLVAYKQHPAVLLSIFKKEKANNLELLDRINSYIESRNQFSANTGINLLLLDDQTTNTRQAIGIMERNALIGLLLVLLTTWAFLGFKMALFTSLGIPFVLAGTFWVLGSFGQTLNSTVLLGIVISLGMLVDDTVVVVEAIYYHLQKGMHEVKAVFSALSEVAAPVSTAVLTTVAAFLPLMLMPGVLGSFMRVVPVVVSVALLVSLVEAFWMLPSHIIESKPDFKKPSPSQRWRNRVTERLRRRYRLALVRVLRHSQLSISVIIFLLFMAVSLLISGQIRVDFFATDLYRIFYVNVEMPPGTSLYKTLETLQKMETKLRASIDTGDVREMVTYAGQKLTETELLFGDEKGQIFVSLHPRGRGSRDVEEVIESIRGAVNSVAGPLEISFLRRKFGPPTSKPISIKVRSDNVTAIRDAVKTLKSIMQRIPGIVDVSDDDTRGRTELSVRLNPDAMTRTRLNPIDVARMVQLYVSGEVAASMQYEGEKLDVRVRVRPEELQDIEMFLNRTVGLPDGSEIPLRELLDYETRKATSNIRHYNLRRAITVEADIDSTEIDTVSANRKIQEAWSQQARELSMVDLDFTGELDDIAQSLNSMAVLFLLGMGLVYLILGTQFKSYSLPLIVLAAVPSAFVGVVFGLFASTNPLSLYTLYGIIALAGIAANDAIVLVSTANRNLRQGWTVSHSIVAAARRRMIPILITSLSTMAGLFSLAAGLGGESLMWGPVATAIVWGLGFSTLLTLFLVPLIYNTVMKQQLPQSHLLPLPPLADGREKTLLLKTIIPVAQLFSRHGADNWITEVSFNSESERAIYEQATRALGEGSFELAMRNYQRLADDNPGNAVFNLCAAQAHIMYMQKNGWDIGYMARARRYLSRARAIRSEDAQMGRLEHAYAELEKSPDASR